MAAAEAYRKIEKYVPQMYNDCMKHIMLISDEKVRDTLEDELIAKVTGYIKMGLQNAIDAYNMASPWISMHADAMKKSLMKLRKEKG